MEDMEVLKRIIEMDSKSRQIEDKTGKIIEENEKNIKMEIEKMEEEIIGKAKYDGKAEMEKLVEKGEAEAARIEGEYEKKQEQLQRDFEKVRGEIGGEIFAAIFAKGDVDIG